MVTPEVNTDSRSRKLWLCTGPVKAKSSGYDGESGIWLMGEEHMSIGILDYAPRPPLYRRRRFWRWIFVSLALAGGACAWWWHEPIWTHAKLAFWYQRCASYSPGADEIVYFDEDPAAMNQSPKKGFFPYDTHRIRQGKKLQGFGYEPPRFENLETAWPGIAQKYSTCSRLPILFMHERTTHAGLKRLIIVVPYEGHFQCNECLVLPPPKWFASIPPAPDWNNTPKSHWQRPDESCARFYAGQIDLADSAHFTIRYEINVSNQIWSGGIIDGFLKDADKRYRRNDPYVELKARDGPAKEPPPQSSH